MANSHLCFLLLLTGIVTNNHNSEGVKDGYRISDGHPSDIEQYPSLVQVDFFLENKGTWEQECAANILTEIFVLSAAHCFSGPNYLPSKRRIRAGATKRNIGGIVVPVQREIIHPRFGKTGYENDLAVVLLNQPLIFSSKIQPATIVSQGTVTPDNTQVKTAGWGKSSKFSPPSDTLLDITVYTINNKLCAERNAAFGDPFVVTKNMICAGLLDIGVDDVCHGDSGGGLFHENVLIGIVSWGKGCANPYFPGVYTNIASYTNWIFSIVS